MDRFADDDLVQMASDRLLEAGLMPPVNMLALHGEGAGEYVDVGVTEELNDALRGRIASALAAVPHKIHQLSPGEGVVYGPPRLRD